MYWIEAKEKKTVMTMKEVTERIENHSSIGPVDFTNCVFEENFDLSYRTIPHSLELQYSIFKKSIDLNGASFLGSYIELTGAELRGGVYFTGLKGEFVGAGGSGLGIFLRKAKIWGRVGLNGAGPISTLCIYDNEYYGPNGEPYNGAGFILTEGAVIERIIVKGDED